jgi:signal transduction histidine kinase/HAMP domain-containing protein
MFFKVKNNESIKVNKSLKLRLILIIPFVLEIFAAVALVGYFATVNSQQAINNLANQLIDRASKQVDDHLDSYLSLPIQIAQMNTDAIKNKELNLDNPITSGRYFWKQGKAFKNISYIGYSLADGREAGVARWTKGIDLILYENLKGKGKALEYFPDEKGNRNQLLVTYDYEPFAETSYKNAVKTGKLIWGEVEVLETSPLEFSDAAKELLAAGKIENNGNGYDYYAAISLAAPIYDVNHNLLGVTSVDIMLNKINDFLQELKVSPSGQVFIIQRDGQIIGSSSKYPNLNTANKKNNLYQVSDSPDPLIRNIYQEFKKQFKNLADIQQEKQINILLDRNKTFIKIKPWRDQYGLDWLVVVAVPESDFLEQIYANTRITIFLCFLALIIAIALGIYTSRWINQPILKLIYAAQTIASGDLSKRLELSNIKEIDILNYAFNRMAEQLQESFIALKNNNLQLEDRVEARTSELKNTLQELQQAQMQIIQSEKMSSLGQMVAGVAHEINNPVNFIHGNITYLDEYTQDLLNLVQLYQSEYPQPSLVIQEELKNLDLEFIQEDSAKILASMKMGTQRIEEIVLSLRNFSRLDEADMKKVDIHEGVESTLLILQHRLNAKLNFPTIHIIKNYDNNLPLVECYAGQLNQVLMNILTNAIDALEEKVDNFIPTITIGTSVVNSQWIEIAIADNGVGMSEEVHNKIFDPFFTTKPVGKGTGMGMSISYQIITQKHGGKLERVSTLGVGTEFLIQIPVSQVI